MIMTVRIPSTRNVELGGSTIAAKRMGHTQMSWECPSRPSGESLKGSRAMIMPTSNKFTRYLGVCLQRFRLNSPTDRRRPNKEIRRRWNKIGRASVPLYKLLIPAQERAADASEMEPMTTSTPLQTRRSRKSSGSKVSGTIKRPFSLLQNTLIAFPVALSFPSDQPAALSVHLRYQAVAWETHRSQHTWISWQDRPGQWVEGWRTGCARHWKQEVCPRIW